MILTSDLGLRILYEDKKIEDLVCDGTKREYEFKSNVAFLYLNMNLKWRIIIESNLRKYKMYGKAIINLQDKHVDFGSSFTFEKDGGSLQTAYCETIPEEEQSTTEVAHTAYITNKNAVGNNATVGRIGSETTPPPKVSTEEPAEDIINILEDNVELLPKNESSPDGEVNEVSYINLSFKGTIPRKKVADKSKEYRNNRNKPNVLGFLDYNGYTGFSSRESNRQDGSLDEASLKSAVKIFQRFNGFPETGELTQTEFKLFNATRCSNRDVDYNLFNEFYTCKDGITEDNEEYTPVILCPNKRGYFSYCTIRPSVSSITEYKKFVLRDDYFFEVDVRFLTGEKYEHIGITFNYNDKTKVGDYIYVRYFTRKLCFSYGQYVRETRKHTANVKNCYYPSREQQKRNLFKIRISVKLESAYVLVNYKDVFNFSTSEKAKSSAFVFVLDGVYYKNNKIRLLTSRLCRSKYVEPKIRRKRDAPYYHSWPFGTIQYSILNFTHTISQEEVRRQIQEAVSVYARYAKLNFKEVQPNDFNEADIVFMFIRGRHRDGLSFDGPGADKAHAYAPVHGEVHFNGHENYNQAKDHYVSLFYLALHEIGHALGLSHSGNKDSVMNEIYDSERASRFESTKELHYPEIEMLQDLYDQSENAENIMLSNDQYKYNADVKSYHPRMPLPPTCISDIKAGLTFYARPKMDSNLYFLFSNGFLWKYKKSGTDFQIHGSYPIRVSYEFPKAEGVVVTAFDTGMNLFIFL